MSHRACPTDLFSSTDHNRETSQCTEKSKEANQNGKVLHSKMTPWPGHSSLSLSVQLVQTMLITSAVQSAFEKNNTQFWNLCLWQKTWKSFPQAVPKTAGSLRVPGHVQACGSPLSVTHVHTLRFSELRSDWLQFCLLLVHSVAWPGSFRNTAREHGTEHTGDSVTRLGCFQWPWHPSPAMSVLCTSLLG
jgi:hypothetical protein